MEIIEIISHYVNKDLNMLEVCFRTINDNEDTVRNDQIDYSIVQEYGFDVESNIYDLFEEIFDDEDQDNDHFSINEDDIKLDEDELLSFLTEYYTINPDNLPKAQFN